MHKLKMNQEADTILFTHYGDNWIRGSERCLLDLIQHLDKNRFTAVLWCNQQVMADQAKALGITVYCSDFPLLLGWRSPHFHTSAFIGLIKQAVKLIQLHNIKLLHANSAAPCQWLNFAARRCGVPLLCHMHSIYQLRDRLTLGLYQVTMAVGVSSYVIEPLVKDKMPNTRTAVIANGIDTQRLLSQKIINLRDSLKIGAGDFVLAVVGSLIRRKGVDLIIQAVVKLLEKQVPVHLLVIGQGPESHNLKLQIEQLGLQRQVTLLGEQDNVIGILRGSTDLFVSAAREEAFGLVFTEAGLAGLAVVGPKTGGIADAVVDGRTGLLVPSEDVDALAAAVHKLYLNPTLSSKMGKAGRKHVLKNFTIEKNTRQFELLYDKLIETPTVYQPWYKNDSIYASLSNGYKRFIERGLIHDR
ncbi:glycosyltransferase family 4 protein [Psychromonas ossibalaenae]|uniref:glycosyltransferase family 4 protein n=1 Tax=Psychromonas ossibalaenae TaxID=444922 RepID=UPI00036B663C|nr:glycosyltransferase family 4 protein [Psychromonas ossibalaenae]